MYYVRTDDGGVSTCTMYVQMMGVCAVLAVCIQNALLVMKVDGEFQVATGTPWYC